MHVHEQLNFVGIGEITPNSRRLTFQWTAKYDAMKKARKPTLTS